MFYIWTMDSHECFGPFADTAAAYFWAWGKLRLPSFSIVGHVPYPTTTVVRKPY